MYQTCPLTGVGAGCSVTLCVQVQDENAETVQESEDVRKYLRVQLREVL